MNKQQREEIIKLLVKENERLFRVLQNHHIGEVSYYLDIIKAISITINHLRSYDI